MQWWNDFVDWMYSDAGWRFVSTAVVPFLAIVVAGVVAALIGRGAVRRVIAMAEHERRVATVTALISAARRASKWNTLSTPEQQHAEHLMHEADTRIRLLALPGSAMVADWSAHEIDQMKSNSVSFSFQAEQSLIDFRNRLVEWQARPGRAKKLFKNDLDTWAYESSVTDQDLVTKQKEWAKRQVNETGPISTLASSSSAAAPAAPATFSSPAPLPAASAPAPAATSPAPVEDTPTQAYTPPSYEVPARLTESATAAASAKPAVRDEELNSGVSSSDEAEEAPATDQSPETSSPRFSTSASGSSIDEGRRTTAPPAVPDVPVDTDAAPGPVSAGSVRQRLNPDTPEY